MQLHQSAKCLSKSIWGMVLMLLFSSLTFGLNQLNDFELALSVQNCGLSTLCELKHGDIHEQIAEVTAMLKEDPKNADLYYKRASLYHGHGSLEEGLIDYQRAMSLGYPDPDIYYFMARLYREKKNRN